jgi:uncharacterized protein
LRAVLDTNVLVSAVLLSESPARRAFDRAFEQGEVPLSLPVLVELYEVLGREKFRRYISEEDARAFLSAFVRKARWVEIDVSIRACRDPKDDKLLEVAVSGFATHLVTRDKDLLSLGSFRGVKIVTPELFLKEPG